MFKIKESVLVFKTIGSKVCFPDNQEDSFNYLKKTKKRKTKGDRKIKATS